MGLTLTKRNGGRTPSSGPLVVDPLDNELALRKSSGLLYAYETFLLDRLATGTREVALPVIDPWTVLQPPSGEVPDAWPIDAMLDHLHRFGARPNQTLDADVEQEVMADYRPRTSTRLRARIRSIERARAELGLSDADWDGLNLSEEDV